MIDRMQHYLGAIAALTGVRLLDVGFKAVRGFRDARWRSSFRAADGR